MSVTAQSKGSRRVTRVVVTMLAVAIAIYIVARLIESVAPVLIACIGIAVVAYTVSLIIRQKRDQW